VNDIIGFRENGDGGGTSMDLALLGNRALQIAIRRNLVCFPSQAPIFGKRPRRDVQWRLAVLYFIRGWSTREIAQRYGLTRERCGQIITDWRIRAVNMGYIQDVTPDNSDELRVIASRSEPTIDPDPKDKAPFFTPHLIVAK
jgi:hypothetical protein